MAIHLPILLLIIIAASIVLIVSVSNYFTPPASEKAIKCDDSDGGINYYVKGACTMSKRTYTDYCTGNALTEYYCYKNICKDQKYECPTQCANGACLGQTTTTTTTTIPLRAYNGSVLVFKESYPNQFLFLNEQDGRWIPSSSQIIKDFYENYSDSVDFIVLFPEERLYAHTNMIITYDVEGVGLNGQNYYTNTTKRLKSLVAIDMIDFFYMFPEYRNIANKGMLNVIMHEMGHHWCCEIGGLGMVLPAHWTYNLDLFNGDPRFVDLMAYYQWIINGSIEKCADGNANDIKRIFSDLTLYLMGLIPENQVSPIKVHNFSMSDDTHYNTWGPSCTEPHNFTSTRNVTIQDIQQINGQRVPSYLTSQKNFNVAFIVLVAYNKPIDYDFVNYVQLYKNTLPEAWSNATKNNSKIY